MSMLPYSTNNSSNKKAKKQCEQKAEMPMLPYSTNDSSNKKAKKQCEQKAEMPMLPYSANDSSNRKAKKECEQKAEMPMLPHSTNDSSGTPPSSDKTQDPSQNSSDSIVHVLNNEDDKDVKIILNTLLNGTKSRSTWRLY
jgi:hypothetical protein